MLVEDIQNAKESIHIEYFLFGIDKGSRVIRRILTDKAKQGVEVRKYTRLHRIIPDLNYRDHRKVMVIDGKLAYTGGMNINDHYFKEWRDTHLRLTGDTVFLYNIISLICGCILEELYLKILSVCFR